MQLGWHPVAIVQFYTQTIHEQHNRYRTIHRTTINTWNNTIKEECGPCPVFARYTLTFALQLRKKHGKTSVRVLWRDTGNVRGLCMSAVGDGLQESSYWHTSKSWRSVKDKFISTSSVNVTIRSTLLHGVSRDRFYTRQQSTIKYFWQ